MDHKIIFYTKALKFEREFNWPIVGPVTFQQLIIAAVVFVIATIISLSFMNIEIAVVAGFAMGFSVWFLYGAIKPDGKKIHRFVIDVVKYWFRNKHKNMGQSIKNYRSKVKQWVRFQD